VVANDTDATIYGNLTIKGVTKPVTLQARLVGAGTNPRPPNKATVGFAATAAIKRSHFGISFGVPIVSDRVDLVINAAFEAE
jgi:polyisoprenoid-binding protein YceI